MTPEQELSAYKDWPETEVCRMLAARIRKARQELGETQAEFAERAGVSLRTYKRFELTGKATLLNFIQVLRTLGRTQHLLMLFPSALPPRPPTVQDKIEALKGKVALERMRRET
jgi:transcriptional regulator with XRE-family HTH domain